MTNHRNLIPSIHHMKGDLMFYISYLICDVLPNNKVYTRDLNDLSNTVRCFKLYFGETVFSLRRLI